MHVLGETDIPKYNLYSFDSTFCLFSLKLGRPPFTGILWERSGTETLGRAGDISISLVGVSEDQKVRMGSVQCTGQVKSVLGS